MPPKLQQLAAEWSPRVNEVIREYLAERKTAATKLTPHLLHSIEVLEEFIFRGGKMLRPLLVILAYQIAEGKDVDAILPVAAGVELFHRHLLNIDDIVDRDEKRYGGPTVWKAYEAHFAGSADVDHHARSMAEVDGILLGSFAFDLINTAKVSPKLKLSVLKIMHQQMYFQTFAGWQIHYYQNQEQLADANEAEFVKGLELVTARYTFVGPLRIGCALAGLGEKDQLPKTFAEYGMHVGLAFQMQDDILGLFGDTKETGKPVGNDVREGKKTLLLQRAYAKAKPADKKFLNQMCGQPITSAQLEKVQKIVVNTGALRECQLLARDEVDVGITALQKSSEMPIQLAEVLVELADFVIRRKK